MKTYPLCDENNELYAFEVSNSFLGSGSIARFLQRCSGCEVLQVRKMFSSSEEHVLFKFEGLDFIVWEPFGDSSRLYIGFSDPESMNRIVLMRLLNVVSNTPCFSFFKSRS